jgi:UDP-N-acetylglucosamine--N-acetylmuramyl-(pentapeptide) pyrophosphoryl-undecaprenol N-acetylglucosamine transferase
MKRVAIATGGTGGHVFAAVAMAEAFSAAGMGVTILYPSGDRAERFLEQENAPRRFDVVPLSWSGVASLRSGIRAVLEQAKAAFGVLAERSCNALVAVGGYPVVGPGAAAFLKGIPCFVYEQNAVAGQANRVLALCARRVLVNIPAHRFSSRQIVVGHPIRRRLLDAAAMPRPQANVRRLLIFGGSQGARSIDDALIALYPLIKQRFPNWRVMHLTGPDLMEKALLAYKAVWGEPSGPDGVFGFRSDMENLLLLADAAVSRAGAMACAELSLFGIPTVFVPYPYAAADHQAANAAYFSDRSAAVVLEEGPSFKECLWGTLTGLMSSDDDRRRLSANMKAASPANDGQPVVQVVQSCINGPRSSRLWAFRLSGGRQDG